VMPGIRMSGIKELQERLLLLSEIRDNELSGAVHDALIATFKKVEPSIPVSGKVYTWPVAWDEDGNVTETRSGPRNILSGSMKRALLNRGDRNHVWRWTPAKNKSGKFRFGVKGGPLFGETAQTGKRDRKPRSSKSKGPKANVARALHFQAKNIPVDRSWPLLKQAIADVIMGRGRKKGRR